MPQDRPCRRCGSTREHLTRQRDPSTVAYERDDCGFVTLVPRELPATEVPSAVAAKAVIAREIAALRLPFDIVTVDAAGRGGWEVTLWVSARYTALLFIPTLDPDGVRAALNRLAF